MCSNMNRYQPAEQMQNGKLVYLIVDTKTNEIMPDWWLDPVERDSAMARNNAAPEQKIASVVLLDENDIDDPRNQEPFTGTFDLGPYVYD